jgi:flavodoxin
MKTLVVYESFFGNTEKIARAIGAALGLADSDVVKAGSVKLDQLKGLELLIVGSPTRGFQPCPETKAFLRSLPSDALKGMKVAAFDTRVVIGPKSPGFLKLMIKIFGYAAEPIGRRLVRKGGIKAVEPAGFLVMESEGPLQDGELERAAEWAKSIR